MKRRPLQIIQPGLQKKIKYTSKQAKKNIEGERILLKNKQTRNQNETSIYYSLVFKTNLLLLKINAVSENEIVQVCVRSQNKPFV